MLLLPNPVAAVRGAVIGFDGVTVTGVRLTG